MRKASVTAQMFRTARRFSTVLAPQLTKLDQIPALQKYKRLIIRIANIERLQDAIKQYVLHTHIHFDPVEFEVRSDGGGPLSNQLVFTVQFYAEEVVLYEGTRRLLSISITDPDSPAPGDGPVVAKVRHPLSGIKVFEVVESVLSRQSTVDRPTSWQINSLMDEMNRCYIRAHRSAWRSALSMCGFSFSSEWWSVEKEGTTHRVGSISPTASLWEENALRVEWDDEVENELRLLTLCFGIVQTIREAYPSLMHIIEENKKRKAAMPNA